MQDAEAKGVGWRRSLKGSEVESGMGRRRFWVSLGTAAEPGRGPQLRIRIEGGSVVGHEWGFPVPTSQHRYDMRELLACPRL